MFCFEIKCPVLGEICPASIFQNLIKKIKNYCESTLLKPQLRIVKAARVFTDSEYTKERSPNEVSPLHMEPCQGTWLVTEITNWKILLNIQRKEKLYRKAKKLKLTRKSSFDVLFILFYFSLCCRKYFRSVLQKYNNRVKQRTYGFLRKSRPIFSLHKCRLLSKIQC